jgi:heme oxygenase
MNADRETLLRHIELYERSVAQLEALRRPKDKSLADHRRRLDALKADLAKLGNG